MNCTPFVRQYDTISDHPVLSMVTTMLDKTFAEIPDGTDLILHSD